MTLLQTSTGTWSVSYNAENRPVRFENTETGTIVECSYDFKGRRFEKKVTREGSVILHHRYVYDGYLQIAALDLTRANAPALWLVLWDPSQPTATRPLALQRYGKWFTYGWDLTKNVTELFGSNGYIKTSYTYDPFGNVSINGATSQDLQWSSEHCDSELALVYYNFRHYAPNLGCFLSRDPIEEQGGWNLYAFVENDPVSKTDARGEIAPVVIVGGIVVTAATYKCITAAALSMALEAAAQTAICIARYSQKKCQEECCKPNYCAFAIAGILGCLFAPLPVGGEIGMNLIKQILRKFGGGTIAKNLGKLGC